MLHFDKVYKSFGDKAVLEGLSFEVKRGEVVGLLAANGGGKTTTMRIALGLLHADAGTVRLAGESIRAGSVRGVGYMPEERGLYSDEKVIKQLEYFGKLHRVQGSKLSTRIAELLESLEIEKYAHTPVKDLSLGNKQRVQIAAALVHSPELLILDEPFSGLDPLAVDRFQGLLKKYAKNGTGILFSSHQVEVVEKISDRILIMKDGKIAFSGTLSEIARSSKMPTVLLHLQFEKGRSLEDVSFDRSPLIEDWSPNQNGAEIYLNTDSISVGDLIDCGLYASEIREISHRETSLMDSLTTIYSKGKFDD